MKTSPYWQKNCETTEATLLGAFEIGELNQRYNG